MSEDLKDAGQRKGTRVPGRAESESCSWPGYSRGAGGLLVGSACGGQAHCGAAIGGSVRDGPGVGAPLH